MATIVAGGVVVALGGYALYRLINYFRQRPSQDRPAGTEDEVAGLLKTKPEREKDGVFARPQESTFDGGVSSDSDDDFVMVEKSMLETPGGGVVESSQDSFEAPPKPALSAPQGPQDISMTTTTTIETPAKRTTSAPPPQVVQPATPTSTLGHDVEEGETALFKTPQQQSPPIVGPKPAKRTPASTAVKATPTSQQDTPTKRPKPSPNAIPVMLPMGEGVALRRRRNEGTVAMGDSNKGKEGEENKENHPRTFAVVNGLSPTHIGQRVANRNLETPISFDEVCKTLYSMKEELLPIGLPI